MSAAPSEVQTVRRSEKIRPAHLELLAVVYVRQSTPQQVLDHQESARLQYSLRIRAREFGWPESRVLVIDEDQGRSAATAEGRTGFQRLVSEVTLGHVGLILGVEMSRLARSCKDWHHLLEACSLFETLLADLDGIYDPAQYNDRLLLGLKGTMSEAELHILKQRMYQGKLSKARRGELAQRVPCGYVRLPTGEVKFDPDEQVQATVRLIFKTFEERRSIDAVLQHFAELGVQLGMRSPVAATRGELEWRRPNARTLRCILRNPFYAGAYAHGRRQVNPRRRGKGGAAATREVLDPEEWHALLWDHYPAYITREQYEANLEQLRANHTSAESFGSPRGGAALLSGLAFCGRCGHRMLVSYRTPGGGTCYSCNYHRRSYGGDLCQTLAGDGIDAHVRARVLTALEPASLELSLAAERQVEVERAEHEALWRQRMEKARYDAERAARCYHAVEPENRLVARQLERDWEEKLIELRRIEEERDRLDATQPRPLTSLEREAIRQLARDIPALWDAPTTTHQERKEIVRQLVRRVTINVEGKSERVQVAIEWIGGGVEHDVVVRPVRCLEQLSYLPRMRDLLRGLKAEGATYAEMAAKLEAGGMHPPKRCERYTAAAMPRLLGRLGLASCGRDTRRRSTAVALAPDEWRLPELARHLSMPEVTLYNWVRRGWVEARRGSGPSRPWIVHADETEIARLRERRARPWGYYVKKRWEACRGQNQGSEADVGATCPTAD